MAGYKNNKIMLPIKEFLIVKGQATYELNTTDMTKVTVFYRKYNQEAFLETYSEMPKGDYRINEVGGNKQLEITNLDILDKYYSIQLCRVVDLTSSPYNPSGQVDPITINQHLNEVIADVTFLFSYLKDVGMVMDSSNGNKILAELKPNTTWFMDKNGNMAAMPVNSLFEGFNQLVETLRQQILTLLTQDYSKLSQDLKDETASLLKSLSDKFDKLVTDSKEILDTYTQGKIQEIKLACDRLLLISEYKVWKANTIEDLKTMDFLQVGDVVEVLGYYQAGDGANHKRIVADSDDGSGVQLDSGLWANVVHNGEVNVSWFGATREIDDAVFQKILDYNCNILFFDKRITINISSLDTSGTRHININNSKTIMFNNSVANITSRFTSLFSINVDDVVIDGLKFIYNKELIEPNNPNNVYWYRFMSLKENSNNVTVQNCYIECNSLSKEYNKNVSNFKFVNNKYFFRVCLIDFQGGQYKNITIKGNKQEKKYILTEEEQYGTRDNKFIQIINGFMYGSAFSSNYQYPTANTLDNKGQNILIKNNYSAHFPSRAVHLGNCNNVQVDSNTVIWEEDQGEVGDDRFSFDFCSNLSFINNKVLGSPEYGCDILGCQNAVVSNNVFEKIYDAGISIDTPDFWKDTLNSNPDFYKNSDIRYDQIMNNNISITNNVVSTYSVGVAFFFGKNILISGLANKILDGKKDDKFDINFNLRVFGLFSEENLQNFFNTSELPRELKTENVSLVNCRPNKEYAEILAVFEPRLCIVESISFDKTLKRKIFEGVLDVTAGVVTKTIQAYSYPVKQLEVYIKVDEFYAPNDTESDRLPMVYAGNGLDWKTLDSKIYGCVLVHSNLQFTTFKFYDSLSSQGNPNDAYAYQDNKLLRLKKGTVVIYGY